MDTLHLPTFARLATFTLLLSPVFAHNDTTNSNNNGTPNPNQCPLHIHRDFNPDAPINSTGSVNIHWNALMMDPARNDWIFTLTYNESRLRQAPYVRFDTQHYLQAYISAPEVSEAQTCVHMFGGLNATSSSSQQNGCDGVLDDACLNFLRNVTFNSGCSIPEPRLEWLDDLREVCGSEVGTSLTSSGESSGTHVHSNTCSCFDKRDRQRSRLHQQDVHYRSPSRLHFTEQLPYLGRRGKEFHQRGYG